MHIAILSGGTGWHVQDLIRAANDLGHTAQAVDFRSLSASEELPLTTLSQRHEIDGRFQAALVRTLPAGSLEQVVFRMDLLHAALERGLPVLNPPRAVETCVDKYLTNVRLAAAKLPTPLTHVAQRAEDALAAFARLGRDVVIKPLFGAEGRGMQRITDHELAWRTFRVLEQTGQIIYQQQFIHHPGYDLRVIVIGGRIRAAMKRVAVNDWRTNVAQGGLPQQVTLTAREAELAVAAAAAVGCPVAGVDLLPAPDGVCHVIEVNAVPGWRALATTCSVDVAALIVRYLADEYMR